MFNLSVYVFLLLSVFISIYIMYCDLRYVVYNCIGSISDCGIHFLVAVNTYKQLAAAYSEMGTNGDGPIGCQKDIVLLVRH